MFGVSALRRSRGALSPPRRRALALAVITVGSVAVLAPASTASAVEGPAPQPREYRVIAGVHTDAVSTFLDEGRLALASKADVEEGNGTRFSADDVWFHLADDARAAVPAGYEFIAAAGTQVWIAPESNPGSGRLWPGFSTESVAAGGVEGNRTTFTLTGLEGPGALELFTGGGLGGTKRLWSSDEDGFTSFPVGRTHMHANWAFTAAGTYRVGVEAAATVGGQRQTARATYTFVVGGLPTAAATTTTLSADTAGVVAGEPVTLDATVTPADAAGWVEFLDGPAVLGHAAVAGGRASIEATALPLGVRSLTARFVPQVANASGRSVSEPVRVTVTEQPGGEVFGIAGLADRYTAGEQIDLRVTGATLREGEKWWWIARPAGQTYDSLAHQGDRYTRDATAALDGTDIRVQLRDAGNKLVQQTDWRRLHVDGANVGSGEPISITGLRDSYHGGDPVRFSVEHRALAGGETIRWVSRFVLSAAGWEPGYEDALPKAVPGAAGTYAMDTSWLNGFEWAYEILDAGGAVVGRSPALSPTVESRELLLSGIRTVYRAGDTLEADSELYPARDDVAYQWSLADSEGYTPVDGATSATLELPVTADLDGKTLELTATDATTGSLIASARKELRVTDAAPGEQLLLLDSLAGHYHQGNTIKLSASADPVAGDTDTYRWWLKRADQDEFVVLEGATAATHELRAEQALDKAQVKAELRAASGDVLATSEPVTVHVDDHGAAPQQQASIDGLADRYEAGGEVRLTASVAPASVLTRWEWHLKKPGDSTSTVVQGANGAQLAFTAGAEHDGTEVFARLTFNDGRTYVQSAPAVLRVDDSGQPGGPGDGPELSVTGLAGGDHEPGASVTLQAVQSPQGPLTSYQWFSRKPGAGDFAAIEGETGPSYGFTVTPALNGTQYLVRLYDGRTAVAASAAVTLKVAVPDQGSAAAKSVTATISETEGALVISVAAQDRAVTLPAAVLNPAGDRWESAGALKPVTVTDTRSAQPGWTASGQIGGFRTADGTSFPGSHLGWTPTVVRQADRQGVTAGPPAAPDPAGQPGTGLSGSAVLASAPGGAGRGTAQLDAALQLSVPTDTAAGVYTGTLTLTAI